MVKSERLSTYVISVCVVSGDMIIIRIIRNVCVRSESYKADFKCVTNKLLFDLGRVLVSYYIESPRFYTYDISIFFSVGQLLESKNQ